ncbi:MULTISPECIES: DUF1259 domain-containing protein [unclassified Rhodanobacter]|uniref:DUF1259 domain-containing protein n=1 Tax=unclassified Rhodanobacter TaxID=2621553 RepID=UPI0009EE697D|nr:DUF1259 domain-containing protein [Rhodanobacter sp. FW510-R10]
MNTSTHDHPRALHGRRFHRMAAAMLLGLALPALAAGQLDPKAIGAASGATATTTPDGVVKIGWSRTDVAVTVDGMKLPPAAGLGSWAAFSPMAGGRAMVMGDTVVFQDEVDAAMDAAFAHGLTVTALHNHFFYDTPKVYFMHIGGEGSPETLAAGVKAVWTAIRAVRRAHPRPAAGFAGITPTVGHINADALSKIVGQPAVDLQGIAKITIGRTGSMQGMPVGGSMGLTTWAAFSGSDNAAAMDGDFIMAATEVQPVLQALRKAGIHVVALHNHMMDVQPDLYFTHFWGKGPAAELARGFRAALDAQAAVHKP